MKYDEIVAFLLCEKLALGSDADLCAVGSGFEFRRRHGCLKRIVPSRHGGTLSSRRAASPLVRFHQPHESGAYTRAFSNGLRFSELWSSNEGDTWVVWTPSSNFHTTSTKGRLSLDRFKVHRPPSSRRVNSGSRFELMTCQLRVRDR
ncbi:hypothetical protein TNCV_3056791 [Trichonephila clavipes]|nr:hypothetical protein TNCV_3056791 [Trichonephila clavipes]